MIHFVIGTRAQLFKMAPIMLECEARGLQWRWVYTAQHKETIQESLDTFGLPDPHYTVMTWSTEAKTMGKIWYWFFKMIFSLPRSKKILGGYTGKDSVVLTHGDTLTTWIGALIGKLQRTKVMHVESGLRSFNVLRPFPEEINRLITFRLSDMYACPGDWAYSNLSKYKGIKINTGQNTQIDTIHFGLKNCHKADIQLPKKPYVVVSIHRYENIFKREQFEKIIELLEMVAEEFQLLFVQHPATHLQIDKYGLRERFNNNPSITMLPRLEYLPFIKCIKDSEFVITDGGGNQEELFHMGKATLLFRSETERKEGIGSTALLSHFDTEIVQRFMKEYTSYNRKQSVNSNSPSELIVDAIEEDFSKK